MSETFLKATWVQLRRLKYSVIVLVILVTMFPALMFFSRQAIEMGVELQDEAQILGRSLQQSAGSLSVRDPALVDIAIHVVLGQRQDKTARVFVDTVLVAGHNEALQPPIVQREFEITLNSGDVVRVEVDGSLAGRLPLMILVVVIALLVCTAAIYAISRFVFKPWIDSEIEKEAAGERLRDVVSLTSDWVWEQNAQQQFSFIAAGETTGLSWSTLRGRKWQDLGHTMLNEAGDDPLEYERLLRTGFRVEAGAEKARIFLIRGKPLYEPNGALKGYRGAAIDVTAREEQERRLQAYQDHLTSEVDTRTAQYLAAKQEAERASRAKSEFLANLSHEIRTPMNAILGLVHLLSTTSLNSRQKSYVENLDASGSHLMRLLNDVLDLSKIESGKLQLDSAAFVLSELVREVIQLMSDRARSRLLSLTAELSRDTPEIVVSDRQAIAQILLNLVSNAIKFTEHGGVTLRVAVESREESRAVIRFEVSDTGVGIDKDVQRYIFEDFVQADSSITRKYGGTGLGLAISRKLCALLNGRIGVDSEPAAGSCFWVSLPMEISQQHAATETRQRDASMKPRETSAELLSPGSLQTASIVVDSLVGKSVLVVEDDKLNQSVFEKILTRAGMNVTVVADGEQAVRVCRAVHSFDLVLMDLFMPVMNGFEAIAQIKMLAGFSSTPIACISGGLNEDIRRSCLAAGFARILSKPVTAGKLLSELTELMPVTREESASLACGDELLMSLFNLLQAGDVGAQAYVDQHETSLKDCMGANFSRFSSQLQNFDFEKAQHEILQSQKSKQLKLTTKGVSLDGKQY